MKICFHRRPPCPPPPPRLPPENPPLGAPPPEKPLEPPENPPEAPEKPRALEAPAKLALGLLGLEKLPAPPGKLFEPPPGIPRETAPTEVGTDLPPVQVEAGLASEATGFPVEAGLAVSALA